MPETSDLTSDHLDLADTRVTRRYFAKWRAITGHLARVAGQMEAEGSLGRDEVAVIARYVVSLGFTFRALANKYHMSGRVEGAGPGQLTFDREESGFPIHAELLQMSADAAQAIKHLKNMPSVARLKDEMIEEIVGKLTIPTRLQYAMSQRLYYEELAKGDLFWPQMDPDTVWLGNVAEGRDPRRKYLVHWAVYDSGQNLPTIYLMEVEDTGRTALPKDETRWPQVQSHLMAQSMGGLKLVTIASGFDRDFDDLHPKRLRRIHVGPMYSHAYTRQVGPLRDVLAEARAPEGEDWALAWTLEELESERVEREKSGWFGTVEREIFALDPFSGRGADTGATRMSRAVILPQRPFQVLAEKNPPGFRDVRKFVVSPGGQVLSYS
ncbi:hypothetical protein [Maritimibacter sp. UBA3975]|uniref:hypothetical protein n=1 Tax=Maritimibacter sp. UBA3975 TaxID=1946833 RepID=UPI000C0B5B13|nr:hypothetical protein [Maritimibacter sp. UBA3975]MAM63977.1 hypothetical protein [Maritimibacter sp.]|tara:strand:+ start:2987 stop:4129 length:1143 start_codon:yes stop_codon:yes gene_type:complete